MNTTGGFALPLQRSGFLPVGPAGNTLVPMYCLFVDLDGVLADFDSGVRTVTGHLPSEQSPRSMWPRIARSPDFYDRLDWLPAGRELWALVNRCNPTILTGLPLGKWAEPQKRAWCARELGRDVSVITCMSRDKAQKARAAAPDGSTPVLIDDRDSLRARFEEAGGIFIHCADHSRAIEDFARLEGEFVQSII